MKNFYRILIYVLGLIVLSLGIILNTKTGLGVSPIISIPYAISKLWNINLGAATAFIYILCVVGQILLLGKKFCMPQLLQIPMSIVISGIINFFNKIITINSSNFIINLILLLVAILLTGIGAALTIEMNIVPNAADGFVNAVSKRIGIKLGFAKNIVDVSSVVITIAISFLYAGKIVGIGVGTVLAVIGVGRAIALVNTLFKDKLIIFVE